MSTRGSRAPPSRARQTKASKRSGKASYRPSATAGTRMTAAAGRDGGQMRRMPPIYETDSLGSTLLPTAGTFIPRDRFSVPPDPDLRAAITQFHNYLDRTGIKDVYDDLCRLLLAQENMPYNPYPGFVKRLRLKAERYHMFDLSDEEILELSTGGSGTEKAGIAYIVHPTDCNHAWGLKSVISLTDIYRVKDYEWMLRSVTPHTDTLLLLPDYSNQVMVALIGPAVFHGTFYAGVGSIGVRVEYLITGTDIERAVNLFIQSVYQDIRSMEEAESPHVVLGVQLPVIIDETWMGDELWTYDRIETDREEFWRRLGDAVTANKYVTAECLFCINMEGQIYKRGHKQYGLNFVEVAPHFLKEEGLHYFTDFALLTLHEGIFPLQSHAEAYLTIFTPRLSVLDKDSSESTAGDPETASMSSVLLGSQASIKSIEDKSGIKRFNKKDKVKIDGFRKQDLGVGPNAWQVTAPIKSYWQKQIAGSVLQPQFFDVLHYILLLVVMDRKSYGDDVIVELYRALHSTAARLNQLMHLNKAVREAVIKFEGYAQSNIVNSLFGQYKEGIADLFDSKLHERSSDQVAACQSIVAQLENLTDADQGLSHTVPLNRKSLETLKNLNSYTYSLLVHMVEDVIAMSPKIKELIESYQVTFPEMISRPGTKQEDAANIRARAGGRGRGVVGDTGIEHGVEDEHIMKHDRQVINVPQAMEKGDAPKIVAIESVLLKYVIDTHMDEVWPQFLVDLFCSQKLPPNPYPRLISKLRQAAMRMDLQYESDDKLIRRVLHGAARVEDARTYVYHIPGCDAHSHLSALLVLDTSTFSTLAPKLQPFINTEFTKRRGPYKIAVCTALSGFTPLYGRMDPYLKQIELNEHCYIRGPEGCWGEAVQVYTKLVFKEMLQWFRRGDFPALGVYIGKDEVRWSVEEIYTSRQAFASEFERHLHRREPCYVKAYLVLDWRLVPVVKHLNLHFMNEEETDFEVFFPDNASGLYQNVFFDKEKAAFHFQYGGPANGANPHGTANLRIAQRSVNAKVIAAKKKQDWVTVYRWLLQRNLMAQGSSVICEAWRMLHSIAGQLEYTVYLGRSLQDAIRYHMELSDLAKLEQISEITPEKQQNRISFVESITTRTLSGFLQKLESVCRTQVSMAANSLSSLLLGKVRKITQRDPSTGQMVLTMQIGSIYVLEEVCQMLSALQDAAAYDIHCNCPEGQAAIRSIEAEAQGGRPGSVESVRLDNHTQYQSVPAAQQPDFADHWETF